MNETESDPTAGFWLDDTPLREWILKCYHEKKDEDGGHLLLLEAIRELLSGAPGGPSVPTEYTFETDPETLVLRFARSLDVATGGLDRAIYEPLIAAVEAMENEQRSDLAPNLSLYVASVSGPIALRTGVDETVVCALVSAALLTIARLGRKRLLEILARSPEGLEVPPDPEP
ncbi:MAG: hypothetical protein O7J95_12880 [Planctomycetota bacterium]|nr:hypothetical protein [Planctomycetota bacterium]